MATVGAKRLTADMTPTIMQQAQLVTLDVQSSFANTATGLACGIGVDQLEWCLALARDPSVNVR